MLDDSSNNQFPWKLHVLIEGAERNGYGHIISWLPAGNAFKVHDKAAFAEVLMPEYFHSNKYKSFQRNLNFWCFQTLTKEPNKGAIFHPYFLRGMPDRCHFMRRVKVKKNSQRMSLAEVRASGPQVPLPSPSPPTMAADFKTDDAPSALPQMSDLNAVQLVLLAQQDNALKQQQQNQIQRQNLVQNLAFLSNSTGSPAPAPFLPSSLLKMSSQTTKLAPSPSAVNSLLLTKLTCAPSAGALTSTSSSSEFDRLKMQISLAALLTKNSISTAGMNSGGMGVAGLLPN